MSPSKNSVFGGTLTHKTAHCQQFWGWVPIKTRGFYRNPIDELGVSPGKVFSFANNAEGFSAFLNALPLAGKADLRIGFEATGHYGLNLMLFLEKNGYSFMELNPALVKQFIRGQTLRKTKTDKSDAKSIAQFMLRVEFNPYPASFYQIYSLKSLTRLRASLVHQRSFYLVQLTNLLDKVFPEFKPFFGNRFSVTALRILAQYGLPDSIARMNSRSYDALRRGSRGTFTMDKFVRLKQLASDTVGCFNEISKIELDTLIDIYSQLDSKVAAIDNSITGIIETINPPTLSIKGIGPVSAAVIVSEYGDFSRFASADKMLSFAGLEPAYYQSGTAASSGRMVKRGSSLLRFTLMCCCRSLRLHNEVFAGYYLKKISEGKPHLVAVSHMAKKLVRLIYKLETTKTLFDPSIQR